MMNQASTAPPHGADTRGVSPSGARTTSWALREPRGQPRRGGRAGGSADGDGKGDRAEGGAAGARPPGAGVPTSDFHTT